MATEQLEFMQFDSINELVLSVLFSFLPTHRSTASHW